ncbi:Aste57867_11755 [Aphanomyces stellatus]|uniref:Aste57867_11755 protein n=1 Tax=Aphanomyces stellatus TaxID=120398 RepID=A0A485KTU6_9STRA|nr:hypothetical protein As57867_011710 [Aphanomyces stellatus]VFT88611.1 Aste57867_11755 [Aphanomyces stellatus]
MGLIGKCCCLSAFLSKILCLALTFGPLVLMYLLYVLYIKPWGEARMQELTHGLSPNSPSLNCSGCVTGSNTQFPTNTTGFLHFLDTSAGDTASTVIGISVLSTIMAALAGLAIGGSIAQIGSSGVHEMMAIVEQGQFVGLLGQLSTTGVPTFFQQFTKSLSWVNLNIAKLANGALAPSRKLLGVAEVHTSSRKLLNLLEAQHQQTGVERYATMLGVLPEDLFYYTLLALAAVIGIVLVLYVVASFVVSMWCSKDKAAASPWVTYFRKVIWAVVLLLLLSLYIVSMTGSYRAYYTFNQGTSGAGSAAIVILLVLVGATLVYGVVVIAGNPTELTDLGTYEHEQRPFNAKYGPYYEEFNVDNRYFFVPKAMLAVTTGIIVGVIQSPMWQLGLLIAANIFFLMSMVVREPFLLRFLFYIGVLSAFLKVFLLILMIIMARDDVFPQYIRDNVAYAIVGINIATFALLVIRQLYVAGHKFINSCGKKKENTDETRADSRQRANLDRQNPSPAQTPDIHHPKTQFNDMEQGLARSNDARNNIREPLNPRQHPRSDAPSNSLPGVVPPNQARPPSSGNPNHPPQPSMPRQEFAPSSSTASSSTPSRGLDSAPIGATVAAEATRQTQKENRGRHAPADVSSVPRRSGQQQPNPALPASGTASNRPGAPRVGQNGDQMPLNVQERGSQPGNRPQFGSQPFGSQPSQAAMTRSVAPSHAVPSTSAVAGMAAAGAILAGGVAIAASSPRDTKEYDVDSEMSKPTTYVGQQREAARVPPQNVASVAMTHQSSDDSYGTRESFGSYASGSRINRPGSLLSDNSSSVRPEPFRTHDDSNDSFQSYQSASYSGRETLDDESTTMAPHQGESGDSFNSAEYSVGASSSGNNGSRILDTLAARYLASSSLSVGSPVLSAPSTPSLVPMLQRFSRSDRGFSRSDRCLSRDVPATIKRTQSLGNANERRENDAKIATKPARHSDSDLHPSALDSDAMHAVFLRYIANDQVHSFMSSEDEIDL